MRATRSVGDCRQYFRRFLADRVDIFKLGHIGSCRGGATSLCSNTAAGKCFQENFPMMIPNALRLASVAIAAATMLGGPYAAAALTRAGELAAHRAVDEL